VKPTTTNPLDVLLRQAVRTTGDALVRDWLRRLLREGEAAASGAAAAGASRPGGGADDDDDRRQTTGK
jgi:hypothetical protein